MLQAQSPVLTAPTSPFVMLPPRLHCSSCWWELTHSRPSLPGLASSGQPTGPWLLVGTGRAYCILISMTLFGKPPGPDLAPLFSRGAEETHPTHSPAQEHPLWSPPWQVPAGLSPIMGASETEKKSTGATRACREPSIGRRAPQEPRGSAPERDGLCWLPTTEAPDPKAGICRGPVSHHCSFI